MPFRRRSRSNSSSSSSSSDSGDDREKKQKKALKKARKAQKSSQAPLTRQGGMSGYEHGGYAQQEQQQHYGVPGVPSYGAEQRQIDPFAGAHPQGPYPGHREAPPGPPIPQEDTAFGAQQHIPAPPVGNTPPPSGYRVPLSADAPFPNAQIAGEPPCRDADGSPVYIGSALLEKSVHPCKIAPHLRPPAHVPYDFLVYGRCFPLSDVFLSVGTRAQSTSTTDASTCCHSRRS